MMLFKDRQKWANKYKEWLNQNPEVADTPLSVITFLVGNGWVSEEEIESITNQVRWERDVALGQLSEVGLTLGQRTDNVVRVVRCKNCQWYFKRNKSDAFGYCDMLGEEDYPIYVDDNFYCADGKLDFSTIEGCCV